MRRSRNMRGVQRCCQRQVKCRPQRAFASASAASQQLTMRLASIYDMLADMARRRRRAMTVISLPGISAYSARLSRFGKGQMPRWVDTARQCRLAVLGDAHEGDKMAALGGTSRQATIYSQRRQIPPLHTYIFTLLARQQTICGKRRQYRPRRAASIHHTPRLLLKIIHTPVPPKLPLQSAM